MLERGRPEFIIDQYVQVQIQYRALQDFDARDAFLEERQQLMLQIQDVS